MENSAPNPNGFQNSLSNNNLTEPVKRFSLPKIILLLFCFLFVAATSLLILTGFKETPLNKPVDYLTVVEVSPGNRSQIDHTKPHIKIKFNFPVEAHHISEYLLISPHIDGELKPGLSSEEVVFEPATEFPKGANVVVRLKAGLPSESGKKLLNDYSFYFIVSHDAEMIVFANREWAGKFMSFQASKGTDITMKIGSSVSNAGIRIYRANINDMLENFTYETTENQNYYYYPGQGKYLEKEIDTTKLKLVQEIKDVKDGQKINFKNEKGIYLFQGVENDATINNVWVSLNEIGVHLRQDDEKIFLAAQNLETGNPESNISVYLYKLNTKPNVLALHNHSGIQSYPFKFSDRLDLVVAKKGEDVMVIPVEIPNSQAELQVTRYLNDQNKIFIYTDRPIYRAGAEVSYRGIVRADNDALYNLPKVKKVRVRVDGLNYNQDVEVSESGIFYGSFKIPEATKQQSYYYMSASADLDKTSYDQSGNTYFEVFEYVKPPFGLDVEVEKSDYFRSDTVRAKVIGKFFDGRPLSGVEVNLSIYGKDFYETEKAVYNSSFKLNGWGGMCGAGGFDEYYGEGIAKDKVIKLDENGEATYEFQSNELKSLLSQEVTFVAEKEDENKNKIISAKSAIVHRGKFNIFFRPGPGRVAYGDEFSAIFYAEDSAGNKVTDKEFQYVIYEDSWYGNKENDELKAAARGSVKTDASGLGVITGKIEKTDSTNNNFYVSVTAKDDLGNDIEGRRGYSLFEKDKREQNPYFSSAGANQTILKITSTQGNLKVGEKAKLEIVAPEDMRVFADFERGRLYSPVWIDLKKGKNTYEFDVVAEFSPSITPTFSFFYGGEYFIEGLSLNVPALHKLVNVEVKTDKDKYNPGDTALITVVTKDANGNLIQSNVGVGIVDKAIYALRKNAAPPLHSFFYAYRARTVNSSSSLTWIATYDYRDGRGGGGGGDNLGMKDSDTLYWNPNLVTGTDGQVSIEIPVGDTETTWRVLTYVTTNDTKLGQETKDFLVSDN